MEIANCLLFIENFGKSTINYILTNNAIVLIGSLLNLKPPKVSENNYLGELYETNNQCEDSDPLLSIILKLCHNKEFAKRCSIHSNYLRNLTQRLIKYPNISNSELLDTLTMVTYLYMHTEDPDMWLMSDSLVNSLIKIVETSEIESKIHQLASELLDSFASQSLFNF